MATTHVRPARDLRTKYSEIVDIVKGGHDHVIITNRGRGDIVLIDIDDYAAYEEYLHVRYVNEKLREAEKEAEDASSPEYSVQDVLLQLRSKFL